MKRLTPVVVVLITLAVAGSFRAGAATWVVIDVTARTGLAATQESWTENPVDYNGDRLQDIWIGYHDNGGKLWRNNGDGTMTWVSRAAWPIRSPVGSRRRIDRHGCAWGDVDGNGLIDAYCTVGRTGFNWVKDAGVDNELWLQTAPEVFSDVGTQMRVGDPYGRGRSAVFFDATGDGRLDLYVLNEMPRLGDTQGTAYGQNKFFVNRQDAAAAHGFKFVRAPAWGLDRHLGFGGTAISFDQDADRRNDLLVTATRRLWLFRNTGSTFVDVAAAARLPGEHVQDVERADIDGDGALDLVQVRWRLLGWQRNLGTTFGSVRTIRSLGTGWAIAVADADGDSLPDVYVQQSAPLWNPPDYLMLNRRASWIALQAPVMGGIGSDVAALALRPGRRMSDFVVLNGGEGVVGPLKVLRLALA